MQDHQSTRRSRIQRSLVGLATAITLVTLGANSATAWDSDFYETGGYIGVSGIGVLTNFGNELGQGGNRPIRGITSASDSGGVRATIGTHITPWFAIQMDFHYIAPIKIRTANNGTQKTPVYTGAITAKGYPLAKLLENVFEGRLQPFVKVSPSVSALSDTQIQSPIAFSIGVGGGTEFWVTESVTINLEGAYWWGTASLDRLEYGTLALGAAYHF